MAFPVIVRASLLNSLVGIAPSMVASHASLHSAVPDAAGSNEISGGSPAYARRPISFTPTATDRIYKAPSPTVQFNVPTGSTVMFCGLWTAPVGGAFLGYAPLSSDAANVGILTASSDKISAPGHGMSANDRVLITAFTGLSTPPGLPPGVYYCDPVNASEYRLRAVLSGPLVDATADGPVIYQRILVDTFSAQGLVTIASLTLGLDG